MTLTSSFLPSRFDGSISVISSPKIFGMLPRLISSMMRTYGSQVGFFSAASQILRKIP